MAAWTRVMQGHSQDRRHGESPAERSRWPRYGSPGKLLMQLWPSRQVTRFTDSGRGRWRLCCLTVLGRCRPLSEPRIGRLAQEPSLALPAVLAGRRTGLAGQCAASFLRGYGHRNSREHRCPGPRIFTGAVTPELAPTLPGPCASSPPQRCRRRSSLSSADPSPQASTG